MSTIYGLKGGSITPLARGQLSIQTPEGYAHDFAVDVTKLKEAMDQENNSYSAGRVEFHRHKDYVYVHYDQEVVLLSFFDLNDYLLAVL